MSATPSSGGEPRTRYELVALGLLFAAGLALRIPGQGTALWLDELWTLAVLRGFDAWSEIFRGYPHSNNHHLMSLWLYAWGEEASPFVLRAPSLVLGSLCVPLAWWAARPGGRLEAVCAGGLTAASFLQVHYASEARGYAPSVAFSYLLFFGARAVRDGHALRGAALLAAGTPLALLSQLVSVHALVAAAVWLGAHGLRRTGSALEAARSVVAPLLVPGAVAAAVAVWIVAPMTVGAGETFALRELLTRVASYLAGGPSRGPGATLAALAATGTVVAGLAALARAGRSEWRFHATVVFFSPAALLLVAGPETLPVRWFVVSAAFALLPAAHLAARGLAAGSWPRVVAMVGLAGFAAGNLTHVTSLWRDGRGDPAAAIRFMARATEGPRIEVGADQDFRARLPLRHYAAAAGAKDLVHVPRLRLVAGWPEWMIFHQYGPASPVPETRDDPRGRRYERAAEFPSSPLSGFHWSLYRAAGLPSVDLTPDLRPHILLATPTGLPVSAATPTLDRIASLGTALSSPPLAAPTTAAYEALLGASPRDERHPTLAERLHRTGYATARFTTTPALAGSARLARGFAHRETGGTTSETVDATLRWRAARPGDAPVFAWTELAVDAPGPGCPGDPAGPGARLLCTDAHLGRLVEGFLRSSAGRETWVIVAGLAPGETPAAAPLVLLWTGRVPAGRRIARPAPLARIAPTILDALGEERGASGSLVPSLAPEAILHRGAP